MFALPIFPGSHPPSIVGVHELNFCVRDGNRWTLMTINTNFINGIYHYLPWHQFKAQRSGFKLEAMNHDIAGISRSCVICSLISCMKSW